MHPTVIPGVWKKNLHSKRRGRMGHMAEQSELWGLEMNRVAMQQGHSPPRFTLAMSDPSRRIQPTTDKGSFLRVTPSSFHPLSDGTQELHSMILVAPIQLGIFRGTLRTMMVGCSQCRMVQGGPWGTHRQDLLLAGWSSSLWT